MLYDRNLSPRPYKKPGFIQSLPPADHSRFQHFFLAAPFGLRPQALNYDAWASLVYTIGWVNNTKLLSFE
ncbi:hypothetical protein SAMN02745216_03719 [Desulfatibacillum alkenivorans DSM 16219]|uniref:Uncharacterized protein n=1 Tax=Desulfatibacillum alkenivorans DSM 16219 TaxID=1121393 RepID=A0A1M6TQH8_9BACT|nr:hypothetical protein SAMN02745216_03719 [Desulfatibacillum alkenivorans DSM 16219]